MDLIIPVRIRVQEHFQLFSGLFFPNFRVFSGFFEFFFGPGLAFRFCGFIYDTIY